jgi:hypothetical protein
MAPSNRAIPISAIRRSFVMRRILQFISKPPKFVRLPILALNHSCPAVTRNSLMLSEEGPEWYYIFLLGRRNRIVATSIVAAARKR